MDDQVDDSSVLPTSKQTLSGIRELSIRCRDLLNQMSTLDSITDAADARDIMTSFNIWAANLGIFDEGRLSVAYRLKDAPQVSHLTEKLLIELERHLEDVITMIKTGTYYDESSSASESENSSTGSSTPSYRLIESSDDDEPLPGQSKGSNIWASIEDTMTGLRQLGLSIRLAGTQHRQERVSRFKKLNGPMYDMFERLAREKIDHNFSKASETLRKRMAESIATRRVRFMYLEKHQNKLSTLSSPEPALQDTKRIGQGQDTTYSAQPQLGSQKVEGLPTLEPRALFSQILSNTVTTKYNTKEIRPIQKAPERGGSVASVVLNSALPPIPKLDPGGASFTCPFCFLVCPANEARGYERWKNHLIHDFEPFFCVYDECSSPFSCSDTFTGLLAHMRDVHTQPKWRCWHCNTASSPKMFSSADELNDHLENCHSTEVKDSLRSTVIEHSIVRAQHALRECPFCGGFPIEIEERPSHQDREEALEKLEKHVREHLANVALILAPRETGEPVDTMSDSISDAKAGKNSERDIEGIGEDELECLNVSCDCHETEKDSANGWPPYCEIEDESDIERITELWNVVSERKRKEFPDDHESQLACAVKYGFIRQPDNPPRPSSPGMPSTQKSQEEDMGCPASQEIRVWTHADYTVGWICVLQQELAAASAMLDQQHPNLSKTTDDHNAYRLGSVSGHNIVVARLRRGLIRDFPIATAAKYMMATFPLIKCILMVGIGAGVPSNDVRLGDVVVGTPKHGKPGVIKWDFGKSLGGFKRTATLKNPHKSLLEALDALKAQDALEGTNIPERLERLKELLPRLPSSYLQSTSLKDLLFEADCEHVKDPEGEGCELCDKSMIVKREPREMLIHHGLVASGNIVIRDARVRDKLNNDLGGKVLCSETETARLGHDFPCLVIRGISDYADSHRNEDWRGHAAFVAAAYAKELLKHLQPRDIEIGEPVKDLLSDDHFFTSRVRQDALNWLTTTDYRLQQSEYRSLVTPGTGHWLLDSKECLTWLATPGQILFCQGSQGIGKTFQTSIVIDHLTTRFGEDLDTGLAYIYCNIERRDQQTPDQLFACILKQLAECLPSLPAAVQSLYYAHWSERTRPSLQQILDTLQAVIIEFSRVFIVIDALDECGVVEGSRKTIFLELARLQQQYGINVLATSRFEPNITMEMESNFSNLVILDLPASEHDIAEYVEDYLSHLPGPFQENSALRDFAKTVVLKSADRGFPFARVYLDRLRGRTTETDILLEIIVLAEEAFQGDTALVDFYQQTMSKIKQQPPYRAALVKQILVWLTNARRELSVTELQHALFTKPLQQAVGSPDLLDEDRWLAVCAGLVAIDRSRNIVQLIHPTLRGYLKSRPSELLPSTKQDIARTCLDYLSLNRFSRGNFTQLQELEEWLASHPFYDYAATNWGHHARESSLPTQELFNFFKDGSAVENSIIVLMVRKTSIARTYFADPPKPESVTLLHSATYFQLTDLVLELLRSGLDPDFRDSQGRTPLSYAAELGYEAIVSLFLEAGAETNSTGLEEHENKEEESTWPPSNNGGHAGRTPLSFAAEYGHVEASEMLIGHGADIGSECTKHDYRGWTPLLFAVYHGHKDVVALLLRCYADPEHPSKNDKDFGKTALSHAAEEGNTAIVRMLLEQGARTEPTVITTHPDLVGHTPLWLAAFGGHEAVVELLLEIGGVRLGLQDKFGRTILSYMAEQGHRAMVGFISNYWTANRKDNNGRTPLSYAAEAGYPAVVQILLDDRADPYLEDKEGETPRSRAIRNGHLEVVAMLEDVSK